MSRKFSAYDISFFIIKKYFKTPTADNKKEVVKFIIKSFDKGISCNDIIKICKEETSFDIVKKKINSLEINEYKNLLKSSEFYYHNELRVTSKPPEIEFDIKEGVIKKVAEEYFLEMRCSYNLIDLYNYLATKEDLMSNLTQSKSRIIGSLKWLIERVPLDILLFLIDYCDTLVCDNDNINIRNIMNVIEYLPQAKEVYQNKINYSKLEGESVVFKRRMLPS